MLTITNVVIWCKNYKVISEKFNVMGLCIGGTYTEMDH
jgi:hypothetical protein